MRIKMKQLYAGPWGSAQPEQVVDRPAAEARRLIANGYAVAVDEPARPARKRPARKTSRSKEPAGENSGGENSGAGGNGGAEGGGSGEGGGE